MARGVRGGAPNGRRTLDGTAYKSPEEGGVGEGDGREGRAPPPPQLSPRFSLPLSSPRFPLPLSRGRGNSRRKRRDHAMRSVPPLLSRRSRSSPSSTHISQRSERNASYYALPSYFIRRKALSSSLSLPIILSSIVLVGAGFLSNNPLSLPSPAAG